MALWNVTNIIKFEYYIESDSPTDAIREAMDEDCNETSESWYASQVTQDEEDEDEDEDGETEEETPSVQ